MTSATASSSDRRRVSRRSLLGAGVVALAGGTLAALALPPRDPDDGTAGGTAPVTPSPSRHDQGSTLTVVLGSTSLLLTASQLARFPQGQLIASAPCVTCGVPATSWVGVWLDDLAVAVGADSSHDVLVRTDDPAAPHRSVTEVLAAARVHGRDALLALGHEGTGRAHGETTSLVVSRSGRGRVVLGPSRLEVLA